MAKPISVYVDVYLVNSEMDKVSEFRRRIGVAVLWAARWLLKSELKIQTIGEPCKPPPLRYWQHGETGRVCASVIQPSERWHEITHEQYDNAVRDMTTNA